MIDNDIQFLIPNSLRVVCEAIDAECANPVPGTIDSQFVLLLKALDDIERPFIARYFCDIPWNISSVRVMACLNQLRILTATEYILSQNNLEHIQFVLNDFLETEFDLLANLFINAHYDLIMGSKVTEYLGESMNRLYADLANDPKANNLNFLDTLRWKLPKDLYTEIINNHLNATLLMQNHSVKSAFALFRAWMKETPEENEIVHNIYKKGISGNEFFVVKSLLTTSSHSRFGGWKNYLLLLGLTSQGSKPVTNSLVKRWLKERLKIVAERGSKNVLVHLLLSIRAVLFFQSEQNETYAEWYKQNIADMKFIFNPKEFQTVLSVLSDLVPYEMDEVYLQVHAKTVISPHPQCSQLCQDYKMLCRTRLCDISQASAVTNVEEDLFNDIE